MYKKILVAMDGSDTSKAALDEALRMASVAGANVHVVYIVDQVPLIAYSGYYEPGAMIDAARKDGVDVLTKAHDAIVAAGLTGDTELTETESIGDDIAGCLQRCAQRYGAELVVMGTHGRRGLKRVVLGSVAERFLRISTVPVLLVRGTEAEVDVSD